MAVAAMRKRERDIRQAFHNAGALDPTASRGLEEMAVAESRGFSRLKQRDVIRESAPGCFYFDEETWQSVRSMRLNLCSASSAQSCSSQCSCSTQCPGTLRARLILNHPGLFFI